MPIPYRECAQCKEQKPDSEIAPPSAPLHAGKCRSCRWAHPRNLRPHLVCERCRKQLPREKFDCTDSGRRRSRNCHDCMNTCSKQRSGHYGESNLVSASPCLNCQRFFYRIIVNGGVRNYRYCSSECVQEYRDNTPRRCRRCHKDKPRRDFDRYNKQGKGRGRGALRLNCRECHAIAQKLTTVRQKLWPTAGTVRKGMRMHGMRHDKASVPLSLAKWALKQNCWLCNDTTRTARLRDPEKPWSQKNTCPLCSLCARLCMQVGLPNVLIQASRIAHVRPLDPTLRPRRDG